MSNIIVNSLDNNLYSKQSTLVERLNNIKKMFHIIKINVIKETDYIIEVKVYYEKHKN